MTCMALVAQFEKHTCRDTHPSHERAFFETFTATNVYRQLVPVTAKSGRINLDHPAAFAVIDSTLRA